MNKAILIGTLGQDPDVKKLNNGKSVANISVATNERWTDKDGQRQERTEWHRVVLFGKMAEIVGQYLKKGSLVAIEGKIQTRKWEDKEGNPRQTTEIVVDQGGKIEMLGGKKTSQSTQSVQEKTQMETSTDMDDDDVPF